MERSHSEALLTRTQPPDWMWALLAATLLGQAASAQQFGPTELLTGHTWGAKSVHAVDLDGDGDRDVVTGSMDNDKICWFANVDGRGTFALGQVISIQANLVWRVFTADLDGDGDQDVLSASALDDKLAWYENTDGLGRFGPERLISTEGDLTVCVFPADLDQDGDQDVLCASLGDDEVAWYENTDGLGSFGPQQLITATADGAQTAIAADLDGDGDLDVLCASEEDDTIAWYANQDGLGSFGPEQVVSSSADRAYSVFAADVDGDGDLDVLSASIEDDTLAWYANQDGRGSFGPEQVVSLAADGPVDVFAVDLDGDGDPDVLSASRLDNEIAWYENADGLGTFGPQQVITNAALDARAVSAADLDGDGDPDVLSASFFDDDVSWWENIDGLGGLGPEQAISTSANGVTSAFAADVDGDGDKDVLSSSQIDDKLAWYENLDGLASFGEQQVFSHETHLPTEMLAVDMDGDGDQDPVTVSFALDEVAWYENQDGLASFGPKQIAASGVNGATAFVSDLDGDGDPDVLTGSAIDSKIAWFENQDGLGGFGPEKPVTAPIDARSIAAADLDGDGDQDILCAALFDDKLVWCENLDGLGSFGPQQNILKPAMSASGVGAADLDGDGDQDVLASYSSSGSKLAWFENQDGLGDFGSPRNLVLPMPGVFVASSLIADMDGDGDPDIVITYFSPFPIPLSVSAWLENDGLGTFGPAQVIKNEPETALSTADLDGDGDEDVISASIYGSIAWNENLMCCALSVDTEVVSLSLGGTQAITLDAGVQKGFDLYYVLTTATGTSPGLSQSPAPLKLPLNFSFLLLFTAQYPNSLVIPSLSFLSGAGTASATLSLPAGMDPGLAGVTLHHAYVLLDLVPFAISGISHPVPLHLVP